MTGARRKLVWALAVAVVVAAACVAALVKLWPRGPQAVPPDLVPAPWTQYRLTPGHETHLGRGKVECRSCHDFERDGFKDPGTAVCKKCHEKETGAAHHGPPSSSTDCLTCHAFGLGRTEPTCIDCHARPQGNLAAIVQHAKIDCADCHRLDETPPIGPAACTGCHGERATKHAEHTGSKDCLDCHRAHESATVARAGCASCHAQATQPHPAAHDACVACHEPHTFVASDSTCVGCHVAKTTLVDRVVPAHRVCVNCHAPHSPGQASAACAACHKDIQVRHGAAGACVDCHTPHGDDPVRVADPCTSCHAKVAASDTSAHAGGLGCEGCHKPHIFGGLDEKSSCRSCHASESALVASNPGHADCVSCHGASVVHVISAPAPCGTCHAAEQKSATAGHERCAGCHEPHEAKPTPACATCHANKNGEPHTTIQGGCATCHRAHGPSGVASPPDCKTCHAPATLPALHSAPGHVACASCHASPHELPHEDRALCTGTCHTDKRDHQPGAQVCTGCHIFRR